MTTKLLKNKKGLIFGPLDEQSIAWNIAEKAHAEGAQLILSNTELALRKGDIYQLAEKTNSQIIAADITDTGDLEQLFEQSLSIFNGKIDFILHSVGMSPNVRKKLHYTNLNYDYFLKTIDISALSLHKVLATAMKLDAINDWGSVVTLSYIGAQRTFSSYSDMAQAKAMLESIVRSFGYHYGRSKKVRINSISQSPTETTASKGVTGFNSFIDYAHYNSPLGNADADACADYCITLFSDYTRMVTMQNLYHDGGFSNMGISDYLIENYFHRKE